MPTKWTHGYKPKDLERAQELYKLAFPPDLVALLLQKRPHEAVPSDKRVRFWSDIIEWNDVEGDGQTIPSPFA